MQVVDPPADVQELVARRFAAGGACRADLNSPPLDPRFDRSRQVAIGRLLSYSQPSLAATHEALSIVALCVFIFGAYAYGYLVALSLRAARSGAAAPRRGRRGRDLTGRA